MLIAKITTATTTTTTTANKSVADIAMKSVIRRYAHSKISRPRMAVKQGFSLTAASSCNTGMSNNTLSVTNQSPNSATQTLSLNMCMTHNHHHINYQHYRLTQTRFHGGPTIPADAPTISLTFVNPDGKTRNTVSARVGETLLQTAHRYDIPMEGACEGVCACSTCHVILSEELYDTLPEPSEDEEDMLDLAFGLTDTSRLGCQVTVKEDMEGEVVELPKATRNFYVDGHVPKPH